MKILLVAIIGSMVIPAIFLNSIAGKDVKTNFRSKSPMEKKGYGPAIQIIDHYEDINTVQQMLAHFKGSPLLIDLWATWCDPCIEEFTHSDSLYTFLSKKRVSLLYLSFDKTEDDSTWKKAIYHYHLYGYHIRANKHLQDEITTLIWGMKEGYSIPHYLIFDSNAALLNKDAPSPGDGTKLYEQIVKGCKL